MTGVQTCALPIWSPDSTLLASGDTAGEVHIWHALDGVQLYVYRGHRRFVRGVAWSSDGALIASGGDFGDSTLQLWHPDTGELLYTRTGQYRIFAVAWSPDGERLAACSFAGGVHTWEASSGADVYCYQGHVGPVYALAWSPDGSMLASAGEDGQVYLWENQIGRAHV